MQIVVKKTQNVSEFIISLTKNIRSTKFTHRHTQREENSNAYTHIELLKLQISAIYDKLGQPV